MGYQHWRYSKDAMQTGWLEIDVKDSSVNVLRKQVMLEWADILKEISADGDLKALCFLSGKPGGFVYGADIAEFEELKTPDDVHQLIELADQVLSAMENLAIPTICGIDGVAVGGGLEVALPCDRIVAVNQASTKLGFPEIHLGILPGYGGTGRALRRIGMEATLDMVLSGRLLGAEEAASWQLVDRLVSDTDALKDAMREEIGNARIADKIETKAIREAALEAAESRIKAKMREEATPAPFEICRHFRRSEGDWQKLVKTERDIFAHLILGEASHHLRRVFFMNDGVRKSARGDSQISHVHVIGAGTMGGDIAAVAALNGFSVSLSDRDSAAIDNALARAQNLFSRRLKSEEAAEQAASRLLADPQGRKISEADIIIEAVAERLEVKQAVFKEVEKNARPEAILATNTSSIMIEDIAAALDNPGRLIGLHFFNPVPVLPLVEVIFGQQSDSQILARAMRFSGQLKKMPVKVKSERGFLVNRALLPYIYEAISRMVAGQSADKMDQAMVRFGMPMGPIELADQVGLDVCYDVGRVLGIPEAAQTALKAKIDAGMLGRKTGSGFYEWEDKKAARARADYPAAELEDLASALLAPMIDKCRSAVEQGIVASRDDADIGCILGIGFPGYRGGPLGWADYPRD